MESIARELGNDNGTSEIIGLGAPQKEKFFPHHMTTNRHAHFVQVIREYLGRGIQTTMVFSFLIMIIRPSLCLPRAIE